MKLKLDLTNVLNSDIGFKTSQYPDGQQSISIEYFDSKQSVRISSHMNSFKDVELIICANQVLKEYGAKNIELYVPYFIGGRSDRKFGTTDTNYLKNVICPIINSQGFSKVIILDPHSDVLEACLTNFVKINNFDLVKYSLTDIDNKNDARERICLVSPDAGAYKKIFDVANRFGINKVVTANKVRDMKTGNIIRTELPTMDLRGIEHLIVIDDICDGGRTFIELAKAIKEITEIPIYLIVTHGIFSAGYFELGKYFSGIYTTNSIKDIDTDIALVKQLNIF
jgi:ribose-phosphate pyrophosphokinase